MLVRKARSKDLDRVIELWWEMELSHTHYDRPFYERKSRKECYWRARRYFGISIKKSGDFIFVVEENGELLGFVKGSVVPRPPVRRITKQGVIGALVVSGAHRRRGVATRLMKAAEKELKKRKVKMAILDVETGNQGARRLYSGLGYNDRHIRAVKYI